MKREDWIKYHLEQDNKERKRMAERVPPIGLYNPELELRASLRKSSLPRSERWSYNSPPKSKSRY
jgi:hypothetical protein